MMPTTEILALAEAGYIFHLLKQWYEAEKRKQTIWTRSFFISIPMNQIGLLILVYIGNQLPEDLLVMSPLTAVMLGFFNGSLLSGFINIKKPKIELDDEEP
jgi:hypothetical protein